MVALREPDLSFDVAELEAAVGPRTRLILLNTPHNPSGKVFDADELGQIARVAVERDLLVVTDEVYEHLIYDGRGHIPLATLPGMAERTLTISSAGKSFGFTGWKIGWASGPEAMVSALLTAKQSLTYVNGGPFQHALVTALGLGDGYFRDLADDLQAKRDDPQRRPPQCGLQGVSDSRHLLHHRRHQAAGGQRRCGVLHVASRALRGGGGSERCVLRQRGSREAPHQVRLLQET